MSLELFRSLFTGLEEAHGYYIVEAAEPGTKALGKRGMRADPVTTAHWERHLDGEEGLGICPINKDSMCQWGVIDIDKYNTDHKAVVRKVEQAKLPLVVCRSKSGGAHVFLFCGTFIPAREMQFKLRALASGLGWGEHEVFPKQTQILADRGDMGSWLNMPYFNQSNTTRYGFTAEGEPFANISDFLAFAQSRRISRDQLLSLEVSQGADEFKDGPVCLQHIVAQGLNWGVQNNGMLALGVFAKKAFPDTWVTKLDEYNKAYFKPMLPPIEVQRIVSSLEKKDYNYRCKDTPLKDYCNAGLCRMRTYGVGVSGTKVQCNSLTKIASNPPIWFLEVEGGRLELETEDLQNQTKFQKKCMDVLNMMPPRMKDADWQKLVNGMMENVNVVEGDKAVDPKVLCLECLEMYLSEDMLGNSQQVELLQGRPFVDREKGVVFFRMQDFMRFLEVRRFQDLKRNQLATLLKENDIKEETLDIGETKINVYKRIHRTKNHGPLAMPIIPKEII
jgi:hypothetical protein